MKNSIMKLLMIFLLLLSLTFITACGGGNGGGGSDDEEDPPIDEPKPAEVVLDSISVDASNAKTSYVVGEEFSANGIVVTAHYSDNTSKVVTNYQVNSKGYKIGQSGQYRIIISYIEGIVTETVVYQVAVQSILDVTVHLIGIDVQPRNVEFLVGSEYNSDTLVVMGVYSDGSERDVTEDVTINSGFYNKDQVGVYEIIIEYSETYGSAPYQETISWDSFYFARVVTTLSAGGE